MATMMMLKRALSLIPMTRRTVRKVTMKTAGRLNTIALPKMWGAELRISGECRAERRSVASQCGNSMRKLLEPAEVARPGNGDRDVAHGVLEDQVPADDPRHEFTQGGVGIRVGAARDGDQGGELGVAERGKATRYGGEQKREHQGRTGSGP